MDYERGYVFDLMEQGGPTDAVVGGVPAKVIRMQDPSEQRE
ncbi:hypothetical protein [Butyrivibrio sp. WCE2006]|nr:hypothetical protein [Butyrivibrio sp. WCE2006]